MKITTPFVCFTVVLIMASLSATPAWASFFELETKLTPSDADAGSSYGISVAISGNIALVGEAYDSDNASGSAYLFDVTTGNQIAKLTASDSDAGDLFGISVAISDNTALVGAFWNNDAGRNSGSAYLFDVTTGNQIAKLTSSDADADDYFGTSVAISGNMALVGAYRKSSYSGSAYLFDVATGNQIAKLAPSDAAEAYGFGRSVAISGNMALIGTQLDSYSGSAYLFDITTGNQIAKLTPPNVYANDGFGVSVAISGDTALVGAFKDDNGGIKSGSAYLFDVTSGNQIAKLTPSDAAEGDRFGWSVAISGNMALVGAHGESHSGSAYLFDITSGNQIAKLTPSDVAKGNGVGWFGWSVAISGNTALVGEVGGVRVSGSAYLLDNIPEPSSFMLATLASLLSFGTLLRHRKK